MTAAGIAYSRPIGVEYSREIEAEIEYLATVIEQVPELSDIYRPRWLAIQLLENDEVLQTEVRAACGGAKVIAALDAGHTRLESVYGEDVDIILADYRYSFVNSLVHNVLTRPASERVNVSDRIDKIITHRWLGIPIFLGLMWVVFKATTDIAAPYLDWVDGVISGPITNWTVSLLGLVGLGGTWLESLFVDGIIAGVGGVLVFVPVLMSLYLALAILEDSGYMARGAFVMDHVMQRVGLHGKSFLPMVVGFGCSVPGLYATRTLENERDRVLTGMLVPFMSCGARLPVYVLFAAIFFPQYTGTVIFGLYLLGIFVAIGLGMLLKGTLLKAKEETPFLIELPPYRWPNIKTVWFYMWERTASFIRNAWSVILVTSIIIWFLMATPTSSDGSFADTDVDTSAFSTISGAIAPIFAPLGFGNWQNTGALITGFVAKEVVVSTTALVYNVDIAEEDAAPTTFLEDVVEIVTSFGRATVDTIKSIPLIFGINLFDEDEEPEPTELMVAIQDGFNATSGGHGALAALAFLVFVLLYTPCMVAIAAMRQELGTKWMWLSIVEQFAIAWIAAFIVFQGGLLLFE